MWHDFYRAHVKNCLNIHMNVRVETTGLAQNFLESPMWESQVTTAPLSRSYASISFRHSVKIPIPIIVIEFMSFQSIDHKRREILLKVSKTIEKKFQFSG